MSGERKLAEEPDMATGLSSVCIANKLLANGVRPRGRAKNLEV
jgi:hypothetical protein